MTVCTLWGERLNTHDIAKILLKEEFNTPYIGLKRNFDSDAEISISFYKNGNRISLNNRTGVYVIFRRIVNSLECLYVGYTEESYSYRSYRWIKELEGKSRDDEYHYGAAIARDEYGVKSSDNFYMKIIPYDRIMHVYEKYNCYPSADAKMIDEHIAHELNALCNRRTRNDNVARLCQII